MQNLQKYNKGYRYILNVIDLYSRYVWSVPIKTKTGKSIVDAFSNIIKNGRKPTKLWVDNGSEFYNGVFKKWLSNNNIEYIVHLMKVKLLLLKDLIVHLKIKCINILLLKTHIST